MRSRRKEKNLLKTCLTSLSSNFAGGRETGFATASSAVEAGTTVSGTTTKVSATTVCEETGGETGRAEMASISEVIDASFCWTLVA